MSDASQTYAVYLTEAQGSSPIGTVVNVIMWDGVSEFDLPPGVALALNVGTPPPYPIGSIYTPPAPPAASS